MSYILVSSELPFKSKKIYILLAIKMSVFSESVICNGCGYVLIWGVGYR